MTFVSSTSLLTAALGSTLLCSQIFAATLIEQRGAMMGSQNSSKSSQTSHILIDAHHARMEASQSGQYMLMDFTNSKMVMINSAQKQAVDMSAMPKMPTLPKAPKMPENTSQPVKATLEKVGKGPDIAGHATEHYQIKADGQVCSNEFISAPAMQVENMSSFMQSMHKMAQERRQAMSRMPFMKQDPCAKATEEMAGEILKHGMLMRSQDEKGQLRHEIVSIKTGVATQADTFSVPAGFETLTPQQMMQRAMQGMKRQGQPKDMPSITPEMREKMQQEMLKRMEEARQKAQ